MTDIDKLLTEAGERWRAEQLSPPPVGPVDPQRRRGPGVAWVTVAGLLVVALLVGVSTLRGRHPANGEEPSSPPFASIGTGPSPASSPRQPAMTFAEAVDGARHMANFLGSGGLITGVQAGPYAAVGPSGGEVTSGGDPPGEQRVWAVTIFGTFRPPGCRGYLVDCFDGSERREVVVFDYASGAFVVSKALEFVPFGDAGNGAAVETVSKFELARGREKWDEAWAMLTPLSQAAIGSESRFIELETAYNAAGGGFTIDEDVVPGPFDATTRSYIGPAILDDFVRVGASAWAAPRLVYVNHPDEVGASASSTAYLVGRLGIIGRIWIVH
jgi:hypothetical protein